MTKLILTYSRFKNEIARLRQMDYHPEKINESAKDEFDEVSKHLNVYEGQNLIATVRMTEHPFSPLKKWLVDETLYPWKNLTANAVEVTRSVVKKEWRQKSIYKFLMVKMCILCHEYNFDYIIAAIEPEMKAKDFLMELGFEIIGKPTCYIHPPFGRVLCHNIVLNLKNNYSRLLQIENNILNQLSQKEIKIIEPNVKQLV